MQREYFGGLFIIVFVVLLFVASYIFDEETVMDNLGRFIVVWLAIAFYAGQYSMRYPKAF